MSELHYRLKLGPREHRLTTHRPVLVAVKVVSMAELRTHYNQILVEALHQTCHNLWQACRDEGHFARYGSFDDAIARRLALAYEARFYPPIACAFFCADRSIATTATLEYVMVGAKYRRSNFSFGQTLVNALINYALDAPQLFTEIACRSKLHLRHFYEDICGFEVVREIP